MAVSRPVAEFVSEAMSRGSELVASLHTQIGEASMELAFVLSGINWLLLPAVTIQISEFAIAHVEVLAGPTRHEAQLGHGLPAVLMAEHCEHVVSLECDDELLASCAWTAAFVSGSSVH